MEAGVSLIISLNLKIHLKLEKMKAIKTSHVPEFSPLDKNLFQTPKSADVIRLRSWNVVPVKKEKVFSPTFLRGKITLKKKSR
jgi:hypothetical protein